MVVVSAGLFMGCLTLLSPSICYVMLCMLTRGHSLKLVKEFSRTDIRRFSFSQRVANEWNSLPEWVVIALILFQGQH